MGIQDVNRDRDAAELRLFITQLLHDVQALESMIAKGMIESGVRRIGAEQELFLVDQAWRPAPVAMEMLEAIADPHYTTELGRFNLEINLDPLVFVGDCLSRMERDLNALLVQGRTVARHYGADIVLTGILPTLRKSDLTLDNMTPKPRYLALSEAMNQLRGGAYEFRLKGMDELIVKHDSVMLEACCTSFQVHYQVGAEEFATLYNLAQAVTAPVLAAATNAPLLFGRRLWKETRIPLFQQAVDTRSASHHLRERSPRVSFGQRWVQHSAVELFQEDLARFRVLLGAQLHEDSLAALQQGLVPTLQALRIHNGTVYRWNRACFGFSDGKPHLRIENRVLPSGPTVFDEIANAAFLLGLLSGGPSIYTDISKTMAFHDAETNFLAAAQVGLDAQFTWVEGQVIPARELIRQELLPIARDGLRSAGIVPADIDRYLEIIAERVRSGQTGSQWILRSLSEMHGGETKDSLLSALTAATVKRQWGGKPVHEWPMARLEEGRARTPRDLRIEEFMTTDLFTVHPDEPIDLVVSLMDWKHIRHIPVEDEQGGLVGVISWFEIVRHYGRRNGQGQTEPLAVSGILQKNPKTVPPETSVLDAIALMQREKMDCLLVVKEGLLVGIVTERDILNIAACLMEQQAQEPSSHVS
jgi:CBS domain-containing protein/gamma-glutamyl:cysteine ligase YbdK (ATP-grasp superfamily)